MDRRLIIVIIAVVVAAHALFLAFRFSRESPEQDSPPEPVAVSEPEPDETDRQEAPESPPTSEAPYDLLSGQPLRSEATDSPPEPKAQVREDPVDAPAQVREVPVDPKAIQKGQLPEGAINLGVHTGTTKLPPEVADVARRGALAVSEQNWEKAREAYLEMIAAVPDNPLAYANLGVAEFQLGNLVAASGNLKRSLELNSSIANNWQTLGLIQYEQKDLNLAISSLTRAIHEAPRDAQARVYLAAVIRDYGWTEAALTELKRAVDIDPKLADAHYNLAVTYLETSPPRIELARRHYYTAVDLGAAPSPELEKAFQAEP